MSDDTPTQRFDQQPASVPASDADTRKRSPLIPMLIGAGALLLVAVVVLALILITRPATGTLALSTNSPTPSASGTPVGPSTPSTAPSPTPSATKAAPPPPSRTLAITSFLVDGSTAPVVYCDTSAPDAPAITVSITWTTQNSTNVYYGVDTTDAQTGGSFSNLPANGSNANFPTGETDVTYPCPSHSQEYTLTIVNGSGGKVSKSVTMTNKGDQS